MSMVALVPTLIVIGFMVAGRAKFSAVAVGLPALSGLQTTFLLDHDLVSFRTHRAHRSWHFLPRPGLVLGAALEELTCSRHHRSAPSTKNTLSSLWQTLFGHPVRAFGTVSLLLLISMAIAPAKNHFSEWRHYQKQYLKLIASRGEAVTLQRHFHEHDGIQQIWLPQLGVVDRCTTCHVGLKEASLADVSTQPFRRHPVIPHTLDQFGCVMCHRGQGAATTVEEAHRSTLAWEQPILPARYVESSCGQCHHAPLTGTPQLNLGRNLLARYGCVHCHTIKLPDGSALKATDDPPSLSHIADKTTREWIYAWLKDPQAYAVTATMPNFKLSDPDARDISAFLIANSTPVAGDAAPVSEKMRRRRIRPPEPASTENPSAPPATPCRMPPEMWWAAMSVRN